MSPTARRTAETAAIALVLATGVAGGFVAADLAGQDPVIAPAVGVQPVAGPSQQPDLPQAPQPRAQLPQAPLPQAPPAPHVSRSS